MPRLLVFTPAEEVLRAVRDIAATCGWEVEDGRAALQSQTPVAAGAADAALFDLHQGVSGGQDLVQQISSASPFLPLIFLSSQGTAVHELGSGLRYHIDPRQLPDLEHVLLSLTLGFPTDEFAPAHATAERAVPRVLIVDDNVQLASLIGRTLRSMERYDVQVVTSGFEALSILPVFQPDVAIIDLVLRDMDGRELCTFIRNHDKLRKTKIIGVSGYLSETRAEDDKVQCDLFLEKPFRMKEILSRVMAFLQ
jgi:CheY-like chemotaxis protein